MRTFTNLRMFLETYDLLFLFTIVCPVDSKLHNPECTFKTSDGDAITYDLLTSYRSITPKTIILSTAQYNKYGYFMINMATSWKPKRTKIPQLAT